MFFFFYEYSAQFRKSQFLSCEAMHGPISHGHSISLFYLYGCQKSNPQTQNKTEKRLFSKEIRN